MRSQEHRASRGRWGIVAFVLLCGGLLLSPVAGCGDGGSEGDDIGDQNENNNANNDAGVPEPRPDFIEPLEAAVGEDMAMQSIPGVAVAIVHRGRLRYAAGFGRRSAVGIERVDYWTRFRIGQLTQILTAIGLLQQHAAGQFDLTDPILEVLPELHLRREASRAKAIQVVSLLSQTSGLHDEVHGQSVSFRGFEDFALQLWVYGSFSEETFLLAPAGAMTNPTGSGAVLAGLITEEVSGEFYADYLRAHVLDPIGLHRTTFSLDEVVADGNHATGHQGKRLVDLDDGYFPPAAPAVGAWASALDLATLARFLHVGNGKVLDDLWRRALFAPLFETGEMGGLMHQGLGMRCAEGFFHKARFYRARHVQARGDVAGFSAQLDYLPDCGLAVIWLANTGDVAPRRTLEAAVEALCKLPLPEAFPMESRPDPALYKEYEGMYVEPQRFGLVSVFRLQNRLALKSHKDGTSFTSYLVPTGYRDAFRFSTYQTGTREDFAVTFVRNPAGKVTYLRNPAWVATRVVVN